MSMEPPTPEAIARAAEALRAGQLIVLPTETVYGLGCNALDPDAVAKVFLAKNRPSENPLIVHVMDLEHARSCTTEWPEIASQLAAAFWPGPLTMVLPKQSSIPDAVTAGRPTVGLRWPKHPVAQKVLEAAQVPVAAPSANRFMRLSPTRAQDIDAAIAPHVAIILDGGAATVGIESTVVDLTGEPKILRQGMIGEEQIAAVLGHSLLIGDETEEGARSAPGQYRRHYAPKTPIRIARRLRAVDAGLAMHPTGPQQVIMPQESGPYAARLYAALADLDQLGLIEIVIEAPPLDTEWAAIWDRLTRASCATPEPD